VHPQQGQHSYLGKAKRFAYRATHHRRYARGPCSDWRWRGCMCRVPSPGWWPSAPGAGWWSAHLSRWL